MPVIDQLITDEYAIYHADCMEVLPTLPDKSIDQSIYSPGFPELYQYSDDVRDTTNCVTYEECLEQYAFIVREIYRLTKPGRLSCVHCTDLRHGPLYERNFPGDIVRIHEEAGLRKFCQVTIWKDAWEFARRTRLKSLMHKTLCADSAMSRIAPADYILVFKKPGANAVPVTHPKGLKSYAGGNQIPEHLVRDFGSYRGDPRGNSLSHWIYRQYASPVWMDIRRGRLLPYEEARENPEEKHVCPLQLDVIERCLTLWSNPGETVLTPFMGVGSEAYMAVAMGRRAIGSELKGTYYRQAKKNVAAALSYSADTPLLANGQQEPDESDDEMEAEQEEFEIETP